MRISLPIALMAAFFAAQLAADHSVTLNLSMSGGVLATADGINVQLLDGTSSVVSTGTVSGDTVNLSVTTDGDYSIVLTLPGYVIDVLTPADATLTINGDGVFSIVATATAATYSVSGSLSMSGAPSDHTQLLSLVFELTDGDGQAVATGTIGMFGGFSFANIPNGTYTYRATLTGYTIVVTPTTITIAGSNQIEQAVHFEFTVVSKPKKDDSDCALRSERVGGFPIAGFLAAGWALVASRRKCRRPQY